jgi:DNA-binding LacI/PurR family transcriptional regulator
MTITIREVAAAAGVSTATVSRALRGLPNVDVATRERVLNVAREMDYVISPSASRLASGRTGSIAVVTPYVARWFFGQVLSGVEAVLQGSGTDLLLMGADPEQGPIAHRIRRRVDGVLVITLAPDDPTLHEVLALGLPTSLIGVRLDEVAGVSIDDVAAGRTATEHLLGLGHTRIAVIDSTPEQLAGTAADARYRGYVSALAEKGIEPDPLLRAFGWFSLEGGERAMHELLAQRPSAVFAMSDEMAFGAMRAMHAHGLVPGRDIAIIGIDGHEMSEYLDLTSIAQPARELGVIAATTLLKQIAGVEEQSSLPHIELPTSLVVRGSTIGSSP